MVIQRAPMDATLSTTASICRDHCAESVEHHSSSVPPHTTTCDIAPENDEGRESSPVAMDPLSHARSVVLPTS